MHCDAGVIAQPHWNLLWKPLMGRQRTRHFVLVRSRREDLSSKLTQGA